MAGDLIQGEARRRGHVRRVRHLRVAVIHPGRGQNLGCGRSVAGVPHLKNTARSMIHAHILAAGQLILERYRKREFSHQALVDLAECASLG
ncbi:hypothetical protein [Dactylosporangium sp. CA-233914]|uniref:hypothetical protein n=1 Tax=Dactylosporangium sp. CA-233914 TaxID=3239934 RepID=UPI003D8F9A2A